jgi:hypothetical protein
MHFDLFRKITKTPSKRNNAKQSDNVLLSFRENKQKTFNSLAKSDSLTRLGKAANGFIG